MRLSQLRDFIAIVETGSLRSAARSLGVSQPAISKSLRQLEQELRVQLLQRNARGAATTRAGKVFLARARVVQSELRRAADDLAALSGGAQGAVAFGMGPASCMRLAPDALAQFRRAHPDANVRIIEGATDVLVARVRDEMLDFCVSQVPEGKLDAGLRFRPLYRPRLAVVGRRGHPLRHARSLRELAGAQWLMFYPRQSGGMLGKMFGAAGLELPAGLVHCESYATALALVAKTDVLGLLAAESVDEPWGRQLQKIDIEPAVPAPLLGLYTLADAPLTAAASAMAQALTATARRLARER
jgi:DNA-binding transcriptional LysR family regulator